MNDWQLIERYVGHGDHSAFAELVDRHLGFVFASARRQVGAAQAEEVTQAVFVLLSGKASSLRPDVVLSSWLFRATGFVVAQVQRREARRRQREKEAATMIYETGSADSGNEIREAVDRHLDAALAALSEIDRRYILSRFFERQRYAELASRFGVTEEAAKKRVARALERMRVHFAKHGVGVSAGILGGLLAAPRVEAVPSGLGAAIAARVKALSSAAGGGGPGWVEAISSWRRGMEWGLGRSRLAFVLGTVGVVIGFLTAVGVVRSLTRGGGDHVPQGAGRPAGAPSTLLAEMRSRRDAAALQPRTDCRIELLVVRADTEEAVGGAVVEESWVNGETTKVNATHATDALGRCVLTVDSRHFETLQLWVSAPGSVPAQLNWPAYELDQRSVTHTCRLSPGFPISGEVRNRAGEPVAGAVVRVLGDSDYPEGSREQRELSLTLRTDDEGRFWSDQVPEIRESSIEAGVPRMRPARWLGLEIEHPAYALGHWEFGDADNRRQHRAYVLDPGFTLWVTVTDEVGSPVPTARVLPTGGRLVSHGSGQFEVRSMKRPEDLGGLPAFSVLAEGFDAYEAILLESDQFALNPGAEEGAQAYDSAGIPIVYLPSGWADPPSFEHVHFVEYEDEVTTGRSATARIRVQLTGSDSPAVPGPAAVVTAREAGSDAMRVSGTVTDAESGMPIRRFRVLSLSPSPLNPERRLMGEGRDGVFNWKVGRRWSSGMLLEVVADGYLPASPMAREPLAEEERLTFQLRRSTTMAGWVETARARPAAGAQVALAGSTTSFYVGPDGGFQVFGSRKTPAVTDREGKFELQRTASVDALLVLHPEGCALFPIGAGEETIIRLEPWATVEGVVESAGQPAVGREVRLRSQLPAGKGWSVGYCFVLITRSDAEGRFRFQRVPPGNHLLAAEGGEARVLVRRGGVAQVQLLVGPTPREEPIADSQ